MPSGQKSLGLLFHFDHFTALVVAALWTGAMRHLALVAIGALGKRMRGKVIVGTTRGRASLGVSPFRICHYRTSCLAANLRLKLNLFLNQLRSRSVLRQLVANLFQCVPSRVAAFFTTVARALVQVLAAMRAQTLAIVVAHRLDRHRQQHLLAQDIFQQ